MKKFSITALVRTADVVDADDMETAKKLFTARYPAMLDKTSTLLDVQELPSKDFLVISKSDLDGDSDASWNCLCDMAGLPKTDKDHPWNERAFAQLAITNVRLYKYNHV